MELRSQILTVLILLMLPIIIESQSLNIPGIEPARILDALLQDYAYRAFILPKSDNATVPNNLTGIQTSALSLTHATLFAKGVPVYKEFNIPTGIITQPSVQQLVLVYQNLGNQSTKYYPLPGYEYLAPVLGLLAYNASDQLPKTRPELEIQASGEPIYIDFGPVKPTPHGSNPICVWVDLHGQANFTNVRSGNRCLAFKHGHFSIVAKSESTQPSSKSEDEFGSRLWFYIFCPFVGISLVCIVVIYVLGIRACLIKRRLLHGTGGGGEATVVSTTQKPTLETQNVP
ncbi:uncharacterized protein LOC143565452 [Bidens hawaiensis]|uniref:uncharacterized protein LOC143565452 n=1 Tax=Bidens hawaiensis TaxID=980011 RepID=UPI00404908D1